MFRVSNNILCVIFLTALMLLTGCIKDLSLDFSKSEKKLVINSIFYPYEPFKVRITTSKNILDNDAVIEQVEGATVSITNNEIDGSSEMLEEIGDGVYRSNELLAFPGHSYTLKVEHKGITDNVYLATSRIPEIGPLSEIDTSLISTTSGAALEVNATIDDIQDIDETYIFEVEIKQDGETQLASLDFSDQDVLVYGDKDSPKRLYLNDQAFDGVDKNLSFRTSEGFPDNALGRISEIKMMNSSTELYQYYKSLEEYERAQNTLNPSSGIPVKVFSNILTEDGDLGLGIFAGAYKMSIILK